VYRDFCSPAPLADSSVTSQPAVQCWWEDETARKRTPHPPPYAEAKKLKSLTLHNHGCLRTSLGSCFLLPVCLCVYSRHTKMRKYKNDSFSLQQYGFPEGLSIQLLFRFFDRELFVLNQLSSNLNYT